MEVCLCVWIVKTCNTGSVKMNVYFLSVYVYFFVYFVYGYRPLLLSSLRVGGPPHGLEGGNVCMEGQYVHLLPGVCGPV